MGGSIYLGRIARIPLYLHWSWFLAVFLIAWTLAGGFFPQSLPQLRTEPGWYWGLGFVAALGLFISVLLHEFGHAVVAGRLGIPVRAIRLFIFGGVAEITGEPRKPSHEIMMALGGPVVTVLLIVLYALGLTLILATGGASWTENGNFVGDSAVTAGAAGVLYYLALINGMVLIFNMIPAFPLDGGRVLRAILWSATGNYLRGTQIAGAIGIGFAWLLYLGGFLSVWATGDILSGIWFFFLGMFLHNAAQGGIAYAQVQHLLAGIRVRNIMQPRPITIDVDRTLNEALDHYFLRHPYKAYPVVHDGRLVGMLTLRGLQNVDRQEWDMLHASDVAERQQPAPVLHPEEPILSALRKMTESGHSRLPVVEREQLVGLLSRRDIMSFLEIRAGLAETRSELPRGYEEEMVREAQPSA
jgi:Zn-dependent protease/CBS domain-containing protein